MRKPKQKLAVVRMPRPEASAAFLAQVERLRDLAMDGEIQAFAFVAALPSGEVIQASHYSEFGSVVSMMGAAEILRGRLFDAYKDMAGG